MISNAGIPRCVKRRSDETLPASEAFGLSWSKTPVPKSRGIGELATVIRKPGSSSVVNISPGGRGRTCPSVGRIEAKTGTGVCGKLETCKLSLVERLLSIANDLTFKEDEFVPYGKVAARVASFPRLRHDRGQECAVASCVRQRPTKSRLADRQQRDPAAPSRVRSRPRALRAAPRDGPVR